MPNILITGAGGQIGSELVPTLRKKYGTDHVVATDIKEPTYAPLTEEGTFELLDALDAKKINELIDKYKIDTIYHLAGILSAAGETNPDTAWMVNINSLKNILDIARDKSMKQVFWPSSIAAFGPGSPREDTPQATIMDPNTIYGITKYSGELLCNYYYNKYRIDVRSLRYPGLISYVSPPGGGTTDYAVDIYYQALQKKKYTSFLREDAMLPMMYMPDAIKGTIDLMEAASHQIKIRTSYNFTAFSFSPEQIADSIKRHIPEFECTFSPDRRQQIADSWPRSIDDEAAQRDWSWKPSFDLETMTQDMLTHLREKLNIKQ